MREKAGRVFDEIVEIGRTTCIAATGATLGVVLLDSAIALGAKQGGMLGAVMVLGAIVSFFTSVCGGIFIATRGRWGVLFYPPGDPDEPPAPDSSKLVHEVLFHSGGESRSG
ncbi:MAG: hypothetical protein F4X83_04290 [Chloroflexi bacterium]|nr:hypothetical protein [Chloroflexota bacterium]